jgi:hypothetical protein
MNFMKKLTIGLLATSLSISANAAFMTVEGTGGFTSAVDSYGNNVTPVNGVLSSTISWGTPSPSYLELIDEAQQDIDTLGVNYLLSTLTHNNDPIDGATLVNAIISGVLNLTGAGLVTPIPGDVINTSFNIDFAETLNGSCDAASKDNGETGPTDPVDHIHASSCDDHFDYTVNGGSFPVTIPVLIAGWGYEITIFAATDDQGDNPLTALRFWTPENAKTSIYTFLRLDLTQTSVPEPTSLAILGLGLLGLASSRKRKS